MRLMISSQTLRIGTKSWPRSIFHLYKFASFFGCGVGSRSAPIVTRLNRQISNLQQPVVIFLKAGGVGNLKLI